MRRLNALSDSVVVNGVFLTADRTFPFAIECQCATTLSVHASEECAWHVGQERLMWADAIFFFFKIFYNLSKFLTALTVTEESVSSVWLENFGFYEAGLLLEFITFFFHVLPHIISDAVHKSSLQIRLWNWI